MPARVEERLVAGGEGGALVVHHLVLRGSNRAIGHHLGEIARTRYGLEATTARDPLRVRVQQEWLRRNAPVLHERMRGAADAFGVDADDDAYDVSRLGAPPRVAGCSAAFVPPRDAAGGHPLVSRAFDFALPCVSRPRGSGPGADRPYLLELHPTDGHATLAVVAFELLGGALDGINAEGLVVVAASDVEAAEARPLEPEAETVGLDELQLGRHLLETCANAIQAREALLAAKHHYAAYPVHWLVADRHGDAFAFEVGLGRNRAHLLDAAGLPLVLTNHALHRHPEREPLPAGPGPAGTYARWRALRGALAEASEPWTPPALAAAAARAFVEPPGGPGELTDERTLWHGVYDLRERALEVTFFERDEPDPLRRGGLRSVRTPPLRFELRD
ncbi:peptidase C45 acyl-coenzyme A:6-aminopenicillanic acid acyl-transferase [Anaeromyxobacter dehalogenans 2CP-1]|uniref:Peptidase C45 acyl-coenzyme A:6-aminopenicillanic acid acyl-transferase n=1 Tax=Anaeromyxobacter dehalogenans (strain ATCC BAA-258 / DSM 21875 / 2CP-1) TaxID=455488 RepID=B8J934_ANAD2|nr:C45 family autoproteolytic acyltransferase/hydolase [Anaeromyxobacter dehalogenans]ACL65440.1 peptidase C45 acyl-coenzyme A:6-aminopenicillanic acid acyl-transferase [Anaeromyxobacter dehalogenans 2CP-1]